MSFKQRAILAVIGGLFVVLGAYIGGMLNSSSSYIPVTGSSHQVITTNNSSVNNVVVNGSPNAIVNSSAVSGNNIVINNSQVSQQPTQVQQQTPTQPQPNLNAAVNDYTQRQINQVLNEVIESLQQ